MVFTTNGSAGFWLRNWGDYRYLFFHWKRTTFESLRAYILPRDIFFEQIPPSRSSLYCKLSFKVFLVTINGCTPEKLRWLCFCEGGSSWSWASIFVTMKPTAPKSMELVLVLMRMCCKVLVWFWSYSLRYGKPFYNCLCSALVNSPIHEPVDKRA